MKANGNIGTEWAKFLFRLEKALFYAEVKFSY